MSQHTLDDKFLELPSSALTVSLVLHGMLIFCVVSVKVLDKMGVEIFKKKEDVSQKMYQSFIQVDVVGLPQQLINEKPSLDTTMPIVEKPKVTKEEVDKKSHEDEMKLAREVEQKKAEDLKRQKDIADMKAKAEEKIAHEKKLKADKEKAKALKQLEFEAKREQALKGLQSAAGKKGRGKVVGNVLSQGTSSTGAIGTVKDRYRGIIKEEVLQHFSVSFWQKKKLLKAGVHLELMASGKVKSRKIISPSSDSLYDSAVLNAIDQSTFPPPDEDSILNDGIDIYFTP